MTLLGWVIRYGHGDCMFIPAERGRTAAELAAARVHGVLVEALEAPANSPRTQESQHSCGFPSPVPGTNR